MKTRKCIISLVLVLALTFGSTPVYAIQMPSDIPDSVSIKI